VRELPLFGVIGRTIAFEVVNLFTLFRLTWLPLAALIAAQYGLAAWLLSAMAADVPYDTVHGVYVFFGYIWVIIVLQVIAFTAVAVRVHRLALFGDRNPGHYFLFPFGATEVRYVIMGVLSSLIVSVPTAVIAYLYYASRLKVTDTAIAALLAERAAHDAGQRLAQPRRRVRHRRLPDMARPSPQRVAGGGRRQQPAGAGRRLAHDARSGVASASDVHPVLHPADHRHRRDPGRLLRLHARSHRRPRAR